MLWIVVAAWLAAFAQASGDEFKPTAQDEFVPEGATLELVWGDGEFTEGPVAAADETILFSDIGDRIMRYDPASSETSVFRAPSGKANGLMFDPRGRLVACEGANGGRRRISITDSDGTVRALAEGYHGHRFNSPNDLAIDRSGRVYFTDPRYVGDEPRELDFEGVFLIDTDGTVKLATRNVQKPNGILVSPDGSTLYVADNNGEPGGNLHLLAFDVAADGSLSAKRLLHAFADGWRGIDGMTLDREGNIYAAAGSGDDAGVYVFGPQGLPKALVPTPGAPTNCTFGVGPLASTLFVTAPITPAAGAAADAEPRYGLYRITLAKQGYHVFEPRRR